MGSRKSTNWLAMWDMYGLECLLNLSHHKKIYDDYEKELIWNKLSDNQHNKKPPHFPLRELILRAKVNSQRQYEIYTFNSLNLSESDIRTWFETTPQEAVNWIRKNGQKLYSDYIHNDRRLIS